MKHTSGERSTRRNFLKRIGAISFGTLAASALPNLGTPSPEKTSPIDVQIGIFKQKYDIRIWDPREYNPIAQNSERLTEAQIIMGIDKLEALLEPFPISLIRKLRGLGIVLTGYPEVILPNGSRRASNGRVNSRLYFNVNTDVESPSNSEFYAFYQSIFEYLHDLEPSAEHDEIWDKLHLKYQLDFPSEVKRNILPDNTAILPASNTRINYPNPDKIEEEKAAYEEATIGVHFWKMEEMAANLFTLAGATMLNYELGEVPSRQKDYLTLKIQIILSYFNRWSNSRRGTARMGPQWWRDYYSRTPEEARIFKTLNNFQFVISSWEERLKSERENRREQNG